MKRLAIITTHPVQYNAPWFRQLTRRNQLAVHVFYTWGQLASGNKYDPGFGKEVEWDIPLLEGYAYSFVPNIAADPGSHHFKGIDNPALIEYINSWGPDAILVFGWSFKSHLRVMRHFKGKIPVLFRGDSTLLDEPEGFHIKKLLRRLFLKWVYLHIDKALYVGTANKRYYHMHGLKQHQLVFAPHAIDNKRFQEAASCLQRNELCIPATHVVFLFCGKFESKKNVALLLDAFIELSPQHASLLLVGNGNLEPQLRQRASKSAAPVYFLPFQNQQAMPSVYRLADVVVLPSKGPGETWGLAANEAMACGRAVLVSDKCGCAVDLVATAKNGYVFKSNNKTDLVEKMKLLLRDQLVLQKMGEKSAEIIKDWNFTAVCKAVEHCVADN